LSSSASGKSVLVDRLPFGETPKVTPVSLDILKEHIQVSHDLDDTLIAGVGGYLLAATGEIEKRGNVSLIRQSRLHYVGDDQLGNITDESVSLGYGPIVSVTAVKYLDSAGVTQTLATTNYRVSTQLATVYFISAPDTLADGPGTIWIEYESGFGDTPASVPAEWQNLVAMVAMRRYEYRDGDGGPNIDKWERMLRRMVIAAGGEYRG
jgi:uncharacterized phiE125 gp8 family phage protein